MKLQYLETLAALALASGPEACAPHDSQIEVREQAEEPELASGRSQGDHDHMLTRWCVAWEVVQEQRHWLQAADLHQVQH